MNLSVPVAIHRSDDTVPVVTHRSDDAVPVAIHQSVDAVPVTIHRTDDAVPVKIHQSDDAVPVEIHRSDHAVPVGLHKRPASTQSFIPIHMYLHLFIRFCGFLLILRSALYWNSYGANLRLLNTGLSFLSRLRIGGAVSPFPYIVSCCSLEKVYLYLIYQPHLFRLILFCYVY